MNRAGGLSTLALVLFAGCVCQADLRNGGTSEFIVANEPDGPFFTYEQQATRFEEIGTVPGRFSFAESANGYRQVICRSDYGWHLFSRGLLRYEQGKYHLIRWTDYRQLSPDAKVELAGERDPM